jgi:hypothetical protein
MLAKNKGASLSPTVSAVTISDSGKAVLSVVGWILICSHKKRTGNAPSFLVLAFLHLIHGA